jgi:PST family polysaccharide transporter
MGYKTVEKAIRGAVAPIRIILLISILALILSFLLADFVVNLVFGADYLTAIPIMRALSPMFISMPLVALYSSFLYSQGKTKGPAKLLIIATLLNILLNYFLISWLVTYSDFMAVIGSSIATVFSGYFHLFGLVYLKKKFDNNLFKSK